MLIWTIALLSTNHMANTLLAIKGLSKLHDVSFFLQIFLLGEEENANQILCIKMIHNSTGKWEN